MKKRKMMISMLLVFFIAAAGVGAYFVHMQKVRAADSSQEIVLEDGQELLYAKIMSISGNEMNYTVLEPQESDAAEPEKNMERKPPNGEMPSERGVRGGGEMPNGGGMSNGEIPNGGEMSNRTVTTYIETGKTGQIQIPVGTDVETKLGTITTFSRLSNGDTVKMLLQKTENGSEELLKIWIIA